MMYRISGITSSIFTIPLCLGEFHIKAKFRSNWARYQLTFIPLFSFFLQGRSKSLTSIDALNPLSAMDIDVDGNGANGGGANNSRSENELLHPGGSSSSYSAGGGDRLTVPPGGGCVPAAPGGAGMSPRGYQRRRKLSTAGKVRKLGKKKKKELTYHCVLFAFQVSSSEFLTVSFECLDLNSSDKLQQQQQEEFVPATRGTCLR